MIRTRTRRLAREGTALLTGLTLSVGLVGLVGVAPVHAVGTCAIATITWDGGGGSTDWSTAANWNPNRLPVATDHVCIPAAAPQPSVVLGASVSVLSIEAVKPLTIGGTLTTTSASQASALTNATISGVLNGAGAKSLLGGASSWLGTISGSGAAAVPVGATLTVPGGCAQLDGATLTVQGSLSLTSAASYACLQLSNGAVIENAGAMLLGDAPSGVYVQSNGTAATVHNTGTISTPGAANGTRSWDSVVGLDNDGIVSATHDMSIPQGAGVSTGSYGAGAGATLSIGNATVNSATTSGAGTVELTGTVTATGAGLALNGAHSTITGTLDGSGPRTIGGASSWLGTISGSGAATVPVGATLTVPGGCAQLDGATLTVQGSLSLTSAASYACLQLSNGAVIENAGAMLLGDAPSGVYVQSNGTAATVHNTGTISTPGAASGTRSWDYGVGLDNDGIVSATHDMSIPQGAGVSTGSYGAGAGATLSIGNATVSGATITGAGTVEATGTVTANGQGLTVTTGHLDVSGTLDGTGPRYFGADSTLRGTLSGTGVATVASGVTVTVPQGCATVDGTTLDNYGTLALTSVSSFACLQLSNGAVIENAGAMLLGDAPSGVYVQSNGTGATVHNTGTISTPGAASGTRSWDAGVGLDNDGVVNATHDVSIGSVANYSAATHTLARGTWAASNGATLTLTGVDVQKLAATVQLDNGSLGSALSNLNTITPAGSLTLRNGAALTTPGPVGNAGSVTVGASTVLTTTGTYSQTGGNTTLEAATATLTATGSNVDVQNGSLTGKGSAGPAISAKATVSPGASAPGVLTASGPYTQTATGHLAIQIGGATVGTQYDRLAGTSSVALGGTLDLSTINGFVPALGQTFTIVTGSSRTGTFANVTGLGAPSGRVYSVSYTATSVVVTVASGPAGPDLVVSTAPNSTPFVTGSTGKLNVVVSNAGGTTTSGTITATVALGTGLTYASATGTGWSCSGGGATATCTRTVAIASGASAPLITVNVNVAAGAVPTTTASTTVSGGGDTVATNNSGGTSIPAQTLVTPIAVFTPATAQSVLTGTTIAFDASASTGSITSYDWDFGDGASGTGVLASHRYLTTGVYTAVLRVTNGVQLASSSRMITVLANIPLVPDAGDDRVVGSGTVVDFTGNQSLPNPGIETYSWYFPDTNTTVPGRDVSHTFVNNTAAPVHVTVTLTITRASVPGIDSVDVTVMPATGQGLAVTVTNGASGLAGAAVTVVDGRGVRYQASTNGIGVGTVYGLPTGSYTAYVFADGYQPATKTATVTNGVGAVTVPLTTGAVGSTVLDSRRLTYDEIVAAGIDPSDPANQNVVHFTICLAFNGASCTVTIDGNGNSAGTIYGGSVAGGGGGACTSSVCSFSLPDGRTGYGTIEIVGGQPVMNFLMISGEARWLKEFFEVKMIVVNLAPAGFTFTGGTASITIPDGLSLAPTAAPQNVSIPLADIGGGQQGSATWIVRGDVQGDYDLSSQYTATLDPVGRSVLLLGKTANPLKVWGRGAVQMIVDADDAAVANEPYRVRIGIQNITTGPEATPVYNPAVELYPVNGANFIWQPREQLVQGTAAIAPGAIFWTDYFVLVPQLTGTLNVAGSFVFLDGNPDDPVPPATITSHPRQAPLAITGTPLAGAAQLTWAAVAGATDYQVFATPDPSTAFTGTPLATVAAGTTTATVSATPSVPMYYAVSATVGGKALMRHALTSVTALPAPTISIGDGAVAEGDAGSVAMAFPVRLSGPSTLPVSVTYNTANGIATTVVPSDYAAKVNQVLTIPAGQTAGVIKVTVLGDGRIEPTEDFSVTLSAPVNGVLGRSSATGTIYDNDAATTPVVSVGDATVVEGNVGNSTATFDVTLDQASASTISVPWSIVAGSAVAPSDYAGGPSTLVFTPGVTSKTISVTIKGDAVIEADETATVTLGSPTGAVVGDGSGTLTILDDDAAGLATDVSIGDVLLTEGDTLNHAATFNVRLNKAAAAPVTVQYTAVAGTATLNTDFVAKTGTLTIPTGAVTASIPVTVKTDALAEPSETFTVVLSAPTGGATLARTTGTATIVDDDPATFVVGVGEASTVEGNSATIGVQVPITLSQPSATAVTVVVNTVNGTANATDFGAVVNRVVTIPAGVMSAVVTINVKGDVLSEADETFTVGLSSPVGATLGRTVGTVRILNDD